jgi:uncharacterized OB-fold protein
MMSSGKSENKRPDNPETRDFWAAAERGELFIKKCSSCGKSHYYPRAICPFCFSDETQWQRATGRATIYSYSTMKGAQGTYTIAYVTLTVGPTMLTNIVDAAPNELRVDQPVEVTFRSSKDGGVVPMFRPVSQ